MFSLVIIPELSEYVWKINPLALYTLEEKCISIMEPPQELLPIIPIIGNKDLLLENSDTDMVDAILFDHIRITVFSH